MVDINEIKRGRIPDDVKFLYGDFNYLTTLNPDGFCIFVYFLPCNYPFVVKIKNSGIYISCDNYITGDLTNLENEFNYYDIKINKNVPFSYSFSYTNLDTPKRYDGTVFQLIQEIYDRYFRN